MLFQIIYTVVVGLMLVGGLWSIIYTLPRISSWRRPVYWVNLVLNIALLGMFGISILRQIYGLELVPPAALLYTLEACLFLVALKLIIVPYIDRLEAKAFASANIRQPDESEG